jgi:hypothetical protein
MQSHLITMYVAHMLCLCFVRTISDFEIYRALFFFIFNPPIRLNSFSCHRESYQLRIIRLTLVSDGLPR